MAFKSSITGMLPNWFAFYMQKPECPVVINLVTCRETTKTVVVVCARARAGSVLGTDGCPVYKTFTVPRPLNAYYQSVHFQFHFHICFIRLSV